MKRMDLPFKGLMKTFSRWIAITDPFGIEGRTLLDFYDQLSSSHHGNRPNSMFTRYVMKNKEHNGIFQRMFTIT